MGQPRRIQSTMVLACPNLQVSHILQSRDQLDNKNILHPDPKHPYQIRSPRLLVLDRFAHAPAYDDDGILMIHDLLRHLRPSQATDRMFSISKLANLDMKVGESSAAYMKRIRGISGRLCGLSVTDILPLFAISNIDQARFPGLTNRYIQGDNAVLNSSIYT